MVLSIKDKDLIDELNENKDAYLQLTKDKKLIEALNLFTDTYTQWQDSLYNEVDSRMDYDKALHTKKIDPFVAGGAVDGALGLGPGIYTGVSTALRNKEIDEERKETKNRVDQFSSTSQMCQNKMIDLAHRIDGMLKNKVKISELRKEYYYSLGCSYIKSKDTEKHKRGMEILEDLHDYKDSHKVVSDYSGQVKRAVDVSSNPTKSRLIIITVIETLIAFAIGIWILSRFFSDNPPDIHDSIWYKLGALFLGVCWIGVTAYLGSKISKEIDREEQQRITGMDIRELKAEYEQYCREAIVWNRKRLPGYSSRTREKAGQKWRELCLKGNKIAVEIEKRTGEECMSVERQCAYFDVKKLL